MPNNDEVSERALSLVPGTGPPIDPGSGEWTSLATRGLSLARKGRKMGWDWADIALEATSRSSLSNENALKQLLDDIMHLSDGDLTKDDLPAISTLLLRRHAATYVPIGHPARSKMSVSAAGYLSQISAAKRSEARDELISEAGPREITMQDVKAKAAVLRRGRPLSFHPEVTEEAKPPEEAKRPTHREQREEQLRSLIENRKRRPKETERERHIRLTLEPLKLSSKHMGDAMAEIAYHWSKIEFMTDSELVEFSGLITSTQSKLDKIKEAIDGCPVQAEQPEGKESA